MENFSLSVYSYPPAIVAFSVLGLGVFILLQNPSSAINRSFAWILLSVFIWLFGFAALYSFKGDISEAVIISKILYIGVIFIPVTFFHFVHRVLRINDADGPIRLHYFTGILFTLSMWFSGTYFMGTYQCYWGFQNRSGPLNALYLAYFIGTYIYCFALLHKFIHNPETTPEERNRYRYIFLSFAIAVTGSIDWLPTYGFNFYPFGFLFIIVFATTTSFAIVKHRLFDIDVIIKRSFIYSLLIFFLTLISLSVILVSEYLFRSYFGYQSVLTALLTSSFVAILFNPIRSRIQKFIDRFFYKADPEKILEENQKLLEEIQKNEKMKSVATLAAGMAHEIKNPLTSIKTFAEYLPERYEDPEFRDKFKRIVVDEVDRVNNIVKQLLEFAKPQEPEFKRVSIHGLLDETIELLNSNLLSHRIQVIRNYAQDQSINADKAQLKQAFLNLFLNSIQAMPVGGTLTVTTSLTPDSPTSPTGGRLLTTITDTGEGIPEEDLKRVFDPFFTTREDGTGLGLSIVHGIITKHGGKLEIKSRPGEGTTVSVILKSQNLSKGVSP